MEDSNNMQNLTEDKLNTNVKFLWDLYVKCNATKHEIFENLSYEEMKNLPTYCPMVFDGWLCWNFTRPGERAMMSCPPYVIGFDSKRYTYRDCLQNGSWFRDNTGQLWANYTDCVDREDLKFRTFVNNLYVCGYTVSFLALMISLAIFFGFRSLRCTRIAIHIHLFTSLLLNNFWWLVWYLFIIGDSSVLIKNGFFCQAVHVIIQYLMVTNYMWMFCEALHLHLLLEVVFVRDDYAMKWFYFIGWILPSIITAIYALTRLSNENDSDHCWVDSSNARWLLVIPVMISMLISLLFLINVMRIMLTKSHSNASNSSSTIPVSIRRAVRAALILTPLFGLHHILLPFRPTDKSAAEAVYDVFSALLISLQITPICLLTIRT
ncbi:calcitonin gene-related peptide type 1 receptor-like isoform X2 [Planococcus citri]|uniref:calcitonin gene-related peptide type 1 receptor-like isoform X2 n=1 Tax=Planococcus citri TaxID=170843 RepID=UPI0031F87DBC